MENIQDIIDKVSEELIKNTRSALHESPGYTGAPVHRKTASDWATILLALKSITVPKCTHCNDSGKVWAKPGLIDCVDCQS